MKCRGFFYAASITDIVDCTQYWVFIVICMTRTTRTFAGSKDSNWGQWGIIKKKKLCKTMNLKNLLSQSQK